MGLIQIAVSATVETLGEDMKNTGNSDHVGLGTPEGRVLGELRKMQKLRQSLPLVVFYVYLALRATGQKITTLWKSTNNWAREYSPMLNVLGCLVGIATLLVLCFSALSR
jgi:hypothetical protein